MKLKRIRTIPSQTVLRGSMMRPTSMLDLTSMTVLLPRGRTSVTLYSHCSLSCQEVGYYISHHMTKTFGSIFGGITCLLSCFIMYRIKALKAEYWYWAPVLSSPDFVEHYSENIADTLNKKNVLLIAEVRYLTTLLLKTFPTRKNIFLSPGHL